MIRTILPALLCCAVTSAKAQDGDVVYVDPVGGVYTQSWIISGATYYAAGIRTVTVIGEGKLGDFKGELYVDCNEASKSKWLSVEDLYLNASDVPLEAIIGIRDALCDGS